MWDGWEAWLDFAAVRRLRGMRLELVEGLLKGRAHRCMRFRGGLPVCDEEIVTTLLGTIAVTLKKHKNIVKIRLTFDQRICREY